MVIIVILSDQGKMGHPRHPRATATAHWDRHGGVGPPLDRDTTLIDKKAGLIDAVNPDLSAFRGRGGKLLIYHGWNDGGSGGAISPQNTVDYYSSVLARIGSQQQDWLRLFMVPGMEHCGGGPGPDQVNWMALERWRESGIAPDRLIASHVSDNRVNMTGPICSYPAVARYNGVGSTNDAANFACKVP
jgi:feruloyl esterase